MGNNFCNCAQNYKISKDTLTCTIETNLSKFEKYRENQSNNFLNQKQLRTKAGTLWNNITGLEKIIITYHVNIIIKYYRQHLKRMKRLNLLPQSYCVTQYLTPYGQLLDN